MSEPHPPTKPSAASLKLIAKGRPKHPSTILPNGVAYLEAAASRGLSQQAAAALMGISGTCLRDCMARQDDAREAWDRGLAALESELTSKWLQMAREGNVACVIFGLKCKAGWRETGPTNGQAEPTTRISIVLPAPMSSEQYRAQLIEAKGEESQR